MRMLRISINKFQKYLHNHLGRKCVAAQQIVDRFELEDKATDRGNNNTKLHPLEGDRQIIHNCITIYYIYEIQVTKCIIILLVASIQQRFQDRHNDLRVLDLFES